MKNYLTNLLILEQSIVFFFLLQRYEFSSYERGKTIFCCTIRCAIDFNKLKL